MNTHEAMCPKCGSQRVVYGRMKDGSGRSTTFVPRGTKRFTLSMSGPHYGLVWSTTDTTEANGKLKTWARPDVKKRLGLE